MNKDLYIDLLESEIRRIRNGEGLRNQLYGMFTTQPFPDYDPEILREELNKTKEIYQRAEMDLQKHDEEIQDLNEQIQDLKLENDRLKRRNELMEDYIHAIACIKSKKSKFYGLCDNGSCPYYDYDKSFMEGACTLGSRELIENEAADLIEKLEEL